MLRKGRLLDLLFTTFITAHYMLYIAHCEVKIQHCEVKNGSCVYGGNKTVKDGYDILSKPPNCTQWVCNVSAEAFVITGIRLLTVQKFLRIYESSLRHSETAFISTPESIFGARWLLFHSAQIIFVQNFLEPLNVSTAI
uniref:Putative 8.9 kDa family member n=1 Tax=Rhipicephalus microplus TaxID=6941 RepID=A0A6M2D4I9_RHIMP